jgi:N4-gp56 family major capsid protein
MLTNFAKLTSNNLTTWSRDMWRQARNYSYINKFAGTDENSMIQRITELKKDEKGARCVITLVADAQGDGVAGDRTLEGNEESLLSFDQVIQLDQLRHANRHEGKMADQRSVVNFRKNSKNILAYWLADRMDQLAFLTLSGVSYAFQCNGAARVGSDFPFLTFAGDVSAPTNSRATQWTTAGGLNTATASTASVAAGDTIAWQTLVDLKAYAKEQYIRGVKDKDGEETYHVFLSPKGLARLKMDNNYMQNLRNAQPRDSSNPLFAGNTVKVDGLYIHESRHVYTTRGAASGSKWGAGSNVDGEIMLFCGAQALGLADIGDAEWVEKEFDYNNQPGISVGKIFGLLKPKFNSIYSGNTVQDFGVLVNYHAI